MAGVWKRDGTVTVTSGSKRVIGVGTTFADPKNGVAKGHIFTQISGGAIDLYEVDYVVSNTELYLVQAFRGTTASGAAYAIITTFSDSIPEFSRKLTATLASYQEQSDVLQLLYTSDAAEITVTAPDGTTHKLIPWKRVTSEGEGQAARAKVEADKAKAAADSINSESGSGKLMRIGGAGILDSERRQIERISGGKNTIIYDTQGNPNVMCVIPRFNVEDLNLSSLNLGVGTHSAFITNGVPRGEILIAKYLASAASSGVQVVGGVQPRVSVNYDTAKQLCTQKGVGWHMMSIHEWAAIALWSLANGTVPRGNTNYGRSHEAKWETARRDDNGAPGDSAGTGRTDTGKGPAAWSHDRTAFGVSDLVGNVWEWVDQMMLDNGRIITTVDNDPSVVEQNWLRHAAYFDASASVGGQPVLSDAVRTSSGPSSSTYTPHFATVTKSPGYVANELLRRLLIESATAATVVGGAWCKNYDTRFPLRGGSWNDGSSAGLGALNLNYARSNSSSLIGFRPAFFV